MRRAETCLEAGTDILLVEAPENEEGMAKIGARFDVTLIDFPEWCDLTGFPEVWNFDKKHAD